MLSNDREELILCLCAAPNHMDVYWRVVVGIEVKLIPKNDKNRGHIDVFLNDSVYKVR